MAKGFRLPHTLPIRQQVQLHSISLTCIPVYSNLIIPICVNSIVWTDGTRPESKTLFMKTTDPTKKRWNGWL